MHLAFQNVSDLFSPMQARLRDGGITVNMPEGDINQIPADKYAEVFDFIHQLSMCDEWMALDRFYKSVPQTRWDYFKLMDVKNAAEHKELKRKLEPFKKLWKPPNGFFNRKIKFHDPANLDS